VEFRYLPLPFIAGAVISLLTALLLIFFSLRKRRKELEREGEGMFK